MNDPASFREAVRKRPGMYLGDPDERGLYRWSKGLIAATSGDIESITVEILKDESISIEQAGNTGIGLDDLERITNDQYPDPDGGALDNLGIAVSMFLSTEFESSLALDGKVRTIVAENGEPSENRVTETKQTGELLRLRAKPDPSIFTTTIFDANVLYGLLRTQALLDPGLKVSLRDLRRDPPLELQGEFPNGFRDVLAQSPLYLANLWHCPNIIEFSGSADGITLTGALRLDPGSDRSIHSWVNRVPVTRGQHIKGFKKGVSKAFRAQLSKKSLSYDQIDHGITAYFSLVMDMPRFAAPTCDNLVNKEASPFVAKVVYESLRQHFESQQAPTRF